jgi:intein/homing endonuclease
MRNFPSPHIHPQSLDSASTPEAFAKREVELGTGTLTCTDHGSLGAAYKVYELAKKNNLTPCVGLEGYFRDDSCQILTKAGIQKTDKVPRGMDPDEWKITHPNGSFLEYDKYQHLTLGFQTYDAYLKGVKLLSKADERAETHGAERKPLFTWDDIEELAATQTTLGSGCLGGIVPGHLVNDKVPGNVKVGIAKAYFERLLHLFKDRFFVEVFPNVCSHNYIKGVVIDVMQGSGQITALKYYLGKKLKTTSDDEIKAGDLADKWNSLTPVSLLAVKNYSAWTEFDTPLKIIRIVKQDGFIQNECSPASPNGDTQWGANRFMIGMAQKYNVPILASDDSHFTLPEQKLVQDVKLAQLGWSPFFSSYHRKTSEEAYEYFKTQHNVSEQQFESWIDNGYSWVEGFKGFKFDNTVKLPNKFFPSDTLANTKRLIDKHGRMPKGDQRYVERLKREIDLFHRNGVVDLLPYFWLGEEACELYSNQGILTGPGRGCLSGSALVITTDGYREIQNVKVGDYVYSHTGHTKRVVNTFKYSINEECVQLETTYKNSPFYLTKDHKLLAFKRTRIEQNPINVSGKVRVWKKEPFIPSWISADDLVKGDLLFVPKIINEIVAPEKIDLAQFAHNSASIEANRLVFSVFPNEIIGGRQLGNRGFVGKVRNGYSPTLMTKDGKKATRGIRGFSKLCEKITEAGLTLDGWRTRKTVDIPRYVEITEDFAYLLGRWIGDGWINKEQRIGVAFNSKDRIGIDKIKNILSSYCVSSPVEVQHKKKRLVQLMAGSTILCRLFRQFFPEYKDSSGTKYIPQQWLNWPQPLLKSLLLGLMDSDGHKQGLPKYSFDTTSLRLVYSFREALLRFGIPSALQTREPFYSGKYLCSKSYKLTFKWTNESLLGYWAEVKGKAYKMLTEVFDLEVEDDHSFLTSEFTAHNSSGGTILAYLLGITHIDPIKYNLSLERFLTLDRIKSGRFPDIDFDFPSRDLLCGYECDTIEVEASDGTKRVLPEDFRIETNKGKMSVKQAIEESAEFDKWW